MLGTKHTRVAWCSIAFVVLTSPLAAQIVEDRPQLQKLTPEERAHRKSTEKLREAQTLFGLGVMRRHSDRWLEAVELLEQATKLDPESAAPYRALVPLYLSLAREEDALQACRKVLELDPDDCPTAFQLAKLLKNEGQIRDAITVLNQAADGKYAGDDAELLYNVLIELADLREKAEDYDAASKSFRRLAKHLTEQKPVLLGGDVLSNEEYVVALARAYEKAGDCQLKVNRYDEAIAAYLESRDFLAKQSDAELRKKAVRLNWNLAKVSISQKQWESASTYLDAYLDNGPVDPEPYEKKVAVLRSLNREQDVLPALKKFAGRMPDALGVQLLYAKELAGLPSGRTEAEGIYLSLAERFTNVEVYKGLFRLYQISGEMVEVLNHIDRVFTTVLSKDEISPETRNAAREQGRLMLQVLRNDSSLVNSLLPVVLKEIRGPKKRALETWRLLAALAARAKQLDKAEVLYRRCLLLAPDRLEDTIYSGLLEVLWAQHKYDEVIALCKEALDGPRKADAANFVIFHNALSLAYSEKEKIDEALKEIDEVIKLSVEANKVSARCRKARILARAERYDDAVAECDAMLKESTEAGQIKQVRYILASIYNTKGDNDKSDAQLLKILEDDPNDPEANNDLGFQWADRNHNLDEAERMIRRAIEVDRLQRHDDPEEEPDNAAYLDSLGWVLFRKGKNEEARDWMEKAVALQLGADDPTVWDHLGDVYFKLKQFDKARTAYQTAVKLYDHDKRGQMEGKQEEAKRKLKMIGEQNP